jgi:hypothetical protein
VKRNIQDKLRQTSEKWDEVWREAQGNESAQAKLVELKLIIQIREAEAVEEMKKLGIEIKGAAGGSNPRKANQEEA